MKVKSYIHKLILEYQLFFFTQSEISRIWTNANNYQGVHEVFKTEHKKLNINYSQFIFKTTKL